MFAAIANVLVRFLSHPAARFRPLATARTEELRALLQPGDVLLVEGNTRIGALIRYATQSTWSHAALYVGEVPGVAGDGPEPNVLIEADLVRGVCAVPLSTYEGFHTRICRPAGLTRDEASRLVGFMAANLGKKYDLKRVFGLARYSLPLLPARLRRGRGPLPERGEPGKAVCSTLIAQAFQSVRYPVFPPDNSQLAAPRHSGLCVPRDFDVSPYFAIVKPVPQRRFDLCGLAHEQPDALRPAGADAQASAGVAAG
ncbi:MAG TPA: lipo-like protein [Burkholderiales bacterium]|nr:lipo-like protein [Burkholderiales bacterium]